MSLIRNSNTGLVSLAGLGAAILMLAAYAVAQQQDTAPSISLEKSTYAPGEDIVVNYSGGPGNKGDWIAVYAKGVVPGTGIMTELWYYSNSMRVAGEDGTSDGTVVLDSASDNPENDEVDWPLASGEYDVYLICCEGYDVLAGPVTLTISPAGR